MYSMFIYASGHPTDSDLGQPLLKPIVAQGAIILSYILIVWFI